MRDTSKSLERTNERKPGFDTNRISTRKKKRRRWRRRRRRRKGWRGRERKGRRGRKGGCRR
jgi:hypothetical protein